jgi:outer membrane autotransporter protein
VTTRTAAVRTANAGGEMTESGLSAGIGGRPSGAWFQGFGSMADKSTKSGFTGYDGKTWGAAAGLDSQVTDSFLVGVFGAFSSTSVKPKGSTTSNNDISSYSGGLYVNYDISNAWYVEGLASGTYHENDSRRSTAAAGGGLVTGKWTGKQYTGRVGTGYAVPMNATWTVTPNAFGQYTTLRQNSYSETGVGALTVTQKNLNTTTAGIGARFTGTYRLDGGWRLVPEARLGVQQDFGSTTPSTSSFFTTTPTATFDTVGKELSKTAGTYGVGLTYRSPGGLDLSGNYDGESRTSFISHTLLARLRQTF